MVLPCTTVKFIFSGLIQWTKFLNLLLYLLREPRKVIFFPVILQNLFAKDRVVLSGSKPIIIWTRAPQTGTDWEQPNKGKHHDADIIFGWNKNEGNWFAVYLLEGYSKDHQSLIQQDTFVRNLNKCGLRLNEIGISTVAFEYGPWSRSQVGKPEGNFGAFTSVFNFRFQLPVFSISWCHWSNYWWQAHCLSWDWNASKFRQ